MEVRVGKTKAIIDPEDWLIVGGHSWNPTRDGYAVATINYKKVLMHRLIMNTPPGLQTDHLNHDKLDNRRSNLRICTPKQNAQNRRISAHKCVTFNKGAWTASVQHLLKRNYLGRFKTEEEAIDAVKKYKEKIRQENKIKFSTGTC